VNQKPEGSETAIARSAAHSSGEAERLPGSGLALQHPLSSRIDLNVSLQDLTPEFFGNSLRNSLCGILWNSFNSFRKAGRARPEL
jgi:hypothetical protein